MTAAPPPASADAPERPVLSAEQRRQLESLTVKDPDDLLKAASHTLILAALGISLAAHLVFVAISSTGLFHDWQQYGLHMPITIKQLKQEQAEKKRLAEQQAKRAEQQRKQKEQTRTDAKTSVGQAPAHGTSQAHPAAAPAKSTDAPPQTLPLDQQKTDPIKEFKLDDSDLGL